MLVLSLLLRVEFLLFATYIYYTDSIPPFILLLLQSSTSATSASVEQTQAVTNGNEVDFKKAATQGGSESDKKKARYFEKYEINETSYHIDTGRIELNVCNDVRSPGE